MNRKTNTPIGNNSVTLGTNNRAAGSDSMAIGNSNVANGNYSFATGSLSNATGEGAFAEGSNTMAAGAYSHTEGLGTITEKDYASFSHAEGVGTTTNNQGEHAEGRYNLSNRSVEGAIDNAGNTMHSVGIGSNGLSRKNAFEIMQNGDVYVIGIGGYDGTNPNTAKTLQQVLAELS